MEMSVGVFELNVLASKGGKKEEAATQATVATPPSHGLSENFSSGALVTCRAVGGQRGERQGDPLESCYLT